MAEEIITLKDKKYTYVFIYVGIFFIYNTILQYFAESKNITFINSFPFRFFHKTATIIICIYALKKIGFKKDFYLKSSYTISAICVFSIIFNYTQTYKALFFKNPDVDLCEFLFFSLNCLATGTFEEILMRVLLFLSLVHYFNHNVKKVKYWKYILVTSFIFGVMHLSHIFSYDVESILTQVIFATLAGILFQSLLIRFNNIFVVITIHTLINFNGMVYHYFLPDNNTPSLPNAYTFQDFILQLILASIIVLISYLLVRNVDISSKVFVKKIQGV
jgi:membrane protease YdiL (CAAX protease family)